MDKKIKMLPYGISGFKELREKDRYCVDKSMYLPKLERAGDFLFLIRPRRFGKSVFLSMMQAYYDMEAQDQFDTLFDGLWIKDHPTELKGKFQVIYFDFSQAVSNIDNLEEQFHEYCSEQLLRFASRYAKYYGDGFYQQVEKRAPKSALQLIYIYMRSGEGQEYPPLPYTRRIRQLHQRRAEREGAGSLSCPGACHRLLPPDIQVLQA